MTNQRQNMRKDNRKQLNDENNRKRCIQSITFIIDNRNNDMSYADRHVTNIATPKGKLGIVLLVKEELVQVYFKTTHRLVHFYLRGERVPNQ